MTVRFLGGVAQRRRRFAFGPAPTFKQDFVTGGGGALPQGATFSRATIGTFYNQSGLIATASTDVARFDYDPNNVLQQNLFVYSNTFANANWGKTSTTVGITSALAPDGTNTATYVMNTVGSSSYIYQNVSSIFLPSTTYIRSFYAQLIVSGSGIIYSEIGGGFAVVTFNLSTGVATSMSGPNISQSMTPVGNGWYYCTHAFTSSATPSLSLSSVTLYMNTYGASANAQSIGLWNQNVNVGSTALPYLATTSTAQTVCAPRGLLIEEARTNLLLQSNDFQTSWTLTNITRTLNSTLSPEGVVNGVMIGATTTAAATLLQGAAVAATAATFSVYAKQGTGPTTANSFVIRNNTTATNLVTGTLNYSTGAWAYIVGTTGAIITNVGNGWWRVQLSASAGITSGDTIFGYAGFSGNAQTAGDFLYAYGAQLEAGAFATSYIPTTSATVTRNADSATVPTGTWYNTAQGTVLAQFDTNALVTTARIIGTQNAAAFLSLPNSTGSVSIFDGTNISVSTLSVNVPTKAASTYVGSTLTICMSGGTPASGTGAGTFPFSGTTTLGLGSSNNGTSLFLNGHIRSFSYYNYALTNAQLQQVTT